MTDKSTILIDDPLADTYDLVKVGVDENLMVGKVTNLKIPSGTIGVADYSRDRTAVKHLQLVRLVVSASIGEMVKNVLDQAMAEGILPLAEPNERPKTNSKRKRNPNRWKGNHYGKP